VTVKMRILKYISYKLDEMISANETYIRFQYFVIYFNKVIQDTMKNSQGSWLSLANFIQ